LKTPVEFAGKSNTKSIKLKRTNLIQSDSDTEKKSITTDVQKMKKSTLNNEITKRKQQTPQKPIPKNKTQLTKSTNKTATTPVRKQSITDTHSSASDVDEKKLEQTVMNSDHEEASSDNDEKSKKESIQKRTKTTTKTKTKSTSNLTNWRDLRQAPSMYDRIKKRARNEQTRNR
jgi:hypothetical protein